MSLVAAATLAATVATLVVALLYVVQCVFSPVVSRGGRKQVRIGRLLFEHVMDACRPDTARQHELTTRKD